ncbi:upstream stimulatory factor 2 isoform 2-T2 [Clarias gariepinus]|uniref:upstream stimulatory factor 2 isoform X2 n=1 Tax=Clarias gariepinus TaxID=13013 RepID=UPI00234C4A2D|nr:upstream stimulatory factor 2 isoform X2 [Clarias gariepinus]
MDVLQQVLDPSMRQTKQEKESLQITEDTSRGGEGAAFPHTSAFTDRSVQYQFLSDRGSTQVTYQVVQLTNQSLVGGAVGVVSSASFAGAQQAVIQSPFSNDGSPAAETIGGEARFSYIPPAAVSDATATGVSAHPAEPTRSHTAGQFYVMSAPDVLQTDVSRTIAPHSHPYTAKMEGLRMPRDERRRAQHNEVERRRRDKINNWIVTLSKIIPDCNVDSTKTGGSKGGILSKACDYIQELRQSNHSLFESLHEMKRVQMDNEILRQQVEELKNENALLRAELQQCRAASDVTDKPSH